MSIDEAKNLSANVRKCANVDGTTGNQWWLRTPGRFNGGVACVDGSNGEIWNSSAGNLLNSWDENQPIGVRPALQLDLSKVVFTESTKTFAISDPVASVTVGGTTTNYVDFASAVTAWNSATNDATLKLLGDTTTSNTISVSGTKTLDLNGHGIKMTGSGSVINVGSGANLTLNDSDTSKTHKFTVSSPASNGAGLATVDDTNGTHSFYGGYITGGNAGNTGGGVYVDGTFTMTSGTIIGNKAGDGNGQNGGGVFIGYGTFTLTGGSIIYNKSGYGGGVYLRYGTFNVTGGTISGNLGVCQGGGLRVEQSSAKFNVSGAPVITGNVNSTTDENVYLKAGQFYITVDGELNENANIGVTKGDVGTFTNSTNTAFNDKSKFTSDNESYIIGKNADNQLLIGVPCTVTYQANGHGTAPTAVKVASGSTITKPTELTASGWTFGGWYNGDTKFDFNTPITKDTTLTAKWVKKPTYTVTIPADVNCSDHNSASAVVSAEYDVGKLYTLSVTVASENNFRLKADYDDSVLIPYTIMCDDTWLSTGQTEILSVSGSGEQNKTLNFSVDPNQMYAGAYSDNLTFHISLN